MLIAPSYYQIHPFNEGLAAAQPKSRAPWGYIDRSGKWAIPPRFGDCGRFQDGIAWVGSYLGNQRIVRYVDTSTRPASSSAARPRAPGGVGGPAATSVGSNLD